MVVTAKYILGDSDATYVLEGADDDTTSYSIIVTVTEVIPGTSLNEDSLKIRDFEYNLLADDDMVSQYEFVVYGELSPRHKGSLGEALNMKGVPFSLCIAIVYHTFNVGDIFEEVADIDWEQVIIHVRMESNYCPEIGEIEIEEVRPTPASRESVEDLEKVVIAENQDVGCTICLDDFWIGFEVTKMPCSHLFHGDCIVRWLENRCTCPLCRFDLLSEEMNLIC